MQDAEIENIASFVIAKSEAGWNSDIVLPSKTGGSTESKSDGTLKAASKDQTSVEGDMKITNILDLPSGASLAIVERKSTP